MKLHNLCEKIQIIIILSGNKDKRNSNSIDDVPDVCIYLKIKAVLVMVRNSNSPNLKYC